MTLKVKHYKELTLDELHDIYRYRVSVFVVEQICPYQEVDDNDKVSCICGRITDSIGIPIQHLQYLPYGEPYIDQRHAGTTYSERFTFTGKEKDSETGYGYFGARYMDHELMTMWLSVDPMADKDPSISPYAYCAWSPVRLVDPNGEEDVMLVYVWFQATKNHRSGGGKITVRPGQASTSVFLGAFSK